MRLAVLILLLMLSALLPAQQSILSSFAPYIPVHISPAALSFSDHPVFSVNAKKQYVKLPDAPESLQLTYTFDKKEKNIFLGINVFNQSAGIFSDLTCMATLGYKLKLSKYQSVAFAVGGGFRRQSVNFSRIHAEQMQEFATLPTIQSALVPDGNLGISYRFKGLRLLLGASKVLQQGLLYHEPFYNASRTYKDIPQYSALLSQHFKMNAVAFIPALIIRTTQGLPAIVDGVVTLRFKDVLTIGAGYRNTSTCYFTAGFGISANIDFYVGYEVSAFHGLAGGAYEAALLLKRSRLRKSEKENTIRETNEEITQVIDKQQAEIIALHSRIDSLDQNLLQLKREIESLLASQLSNEDIRKRISVNYTVPVSNDTLIREKNLPRIQADKYYMHTDSSGLTGSEPGGLFYTVYGVYQDIRFARSFQKFLRREMGYNTMLLKSSTSEGGFIYVCDNRVHENLSAAVKLMYSSRREIGKKEIKITKGEPWVLQYAEQ
jgi:type IX secretion system PorP/SprF family membrane protein